MSKVVRQHGQTIFRHLRLNKHGFEEARFLGHEECECVAVSTCPALREQVHADADTIGKLYTLLYISRKWGFRGINYFSYTLL